jgi:UDP-N-acetylmuramoylalanine--D-glutamate ligase
MTTDVEDRSERMAMKEFSVAGERVVVVGAGRSGQAAAMLLARRRAHVTLTDTQKDVPGVGELRAAGVALELGGHQPETLANADLIVLSPGVPPNVPAVRSARRSGVPIMGELELASRWLRGRIVAITGTKGKSTTTTLTGRMCEAAGLKVMVGGNIGTPLSSQVESSTPDALHVVETSSFQLEGTDTFHPWIAVLLNLFPDHLDRHADFAEYAAAKGRIFANQTEEDWAVINADDPQALTLARATRARRFEFSLTGKIQDGIVAGPSAISLRSGSTDTPLIPLTSVRLLGRHLLDDVMAAASAARLAGVPAAAMIRAVESFTGLEHALEPAGEVAGVRFVNDSKATNVESARRAILSFHQGLVPILGGRFKGGDFRDLEQPLAGRATAVIALGEARGLIHDALGRSFKVLDADSMAAAVRAAFGVAPVGGTVLLAPACASFDMFRDYAERGRIFKEEVRRLAEEQSATRER